MKMKVNTKGNIIKYVILFFTYKNYIIYELHSLKNI